VMHEQYLNIYNSLLYESYYGFCKLISNRINFLENLAYNHFNDISEPFADPNIHNILISQLFEMAGYWQKYCADKYNRGIFTENDADPQEDIVGIKVVIHASPKQLRSLDDEYEIVESENSEVYLNPNTYRKDDKGQIVTQRKEIPNGIIMAIAKRKKMQSTAQNDLAYISDVLVVRKPTNKDFVWRDSTLSHFLKESGYKLLPLHLLNGKLFDDSMSMATYNLNANDDLLRGAQTLIYYLKSKGTRSRISKISLITTPHGKNLPVYNPIETVLPVPTNDQMNDGYGSLLLRYAALTLSGEYETPTRLVIHRIFDVKCPILRQYGELGGLYCNDLTERTKTNGDFIKSYNEKKAELEVFIKINAAKIKEFGDYLRYCRRYCKPFLTQKFEDLGYTLFASIEGCILACRNVVLDLLK